MNVNQVLDIFPDPSETVEDYSCIWLLATDGNNRNGYLRLDFLKHPAFEKLSGTFSPSEEELALAEKLLRSDDSIVDFSKRPRLEDASPALQNLFDEMESADAITYFDLEENAEWENLGLSREDDEKQIDEDIQKYGLDGIVCKYSEEDSLYTCYGDFLCYFSKSSGKELKALEKNADSSGITSLSPDGSNPLVSISFVPIDFQRDKDNPFRVCEIMDRSQENPCVTYVVVHDGKDEAMFTAFIGKGQQQDHAFLSALDYIVGAYHDAPELALDHFDGAAYVKKFYEIAFFSNPATRLQYSPMELDAYWKRQLPEYLPSSVFGDSLINGALSPGFSKEIESLFNATLENPMFQVNEALIAQLNEQPPISEIGVLGTNTDIVDTPLFAAAQYEWENERTRKIFDASEKELFAFLTAVDSSMEKYGPTRASLDCFSDMLNDLCYGREGMLKGMGIPLSSSFGSSKNMDSVYVKCHKVLKSFEQSMKQNFSNGRFA